MKKLTASQKSAWLPPPPVDLERPYALGNYAFQDVSTAIARKYLDRSANLQRAWVRICTHMPEIIGTDETLSILEFSTAHGAMLEIFQALGHNAEGTDYCVPQQYRRKFKPVSPDNAVFRSLHSNPVAVSQDGWLYQPIIESIGGKVHLFDAGQTPYAFADDSFDYVCCYQALDSYADPSGWEAIVEEFCRIARRAVVIGFNPPGLSAEESRGWGETEKAWEKLRSFDACGFRNVFFEFDTTSRGLHPSACKLVKTGADKR